ncbi:MAG: carbonic anhydrase [Myxococcota bacterium]
MAPPIAAVTALDRLKEGNRRFAANVRSIDALLSQTRRTELVAGQKPFAIVLGCSDSRSPAEIVFDQGLGDLFVIRVAGNVVAPSQVASVEFAAQRFETPLAVVMGHTACGAIEATLEVLSRPDEPGAAALRSIVERIRPAVEPLLHAGVTQDRRELITACAKAHVRAGADHLRHGSPVIEQLVAEKRLWVVGALYDLASGTVDFFDGAP